MTGDWRFQLVVNYRIWAPRRGKLVDRLQRTGHYVRMVDAGVAFMIGKRRRPIGMSTGFGRRILIFGFMQRGAAERAERRVNLLPVDDVKVAIYEVSDGRA